MLHVTCKKTSRVDVYDIGDARTCTITHVPYSTEIMPTLIACYKAATGGMGLISKTVVLPRN